MSAAAKRHPGTLRGSVSSDRCAAPATGRGPGHLCAGRAEDAAAGPELRPRRGPCTCRAGTPGASSPAPPRPPRARDRGAGLRGAATPDGEGSGGGSGSPSRQRAGAGAGAGAGGPRGARASALSEVPARSARGPGDPCPGSAGERPRAPDRRPPGGGCGGPRGRVWPPAAAAPPRKPRGAGGRAGGCGGGGRARGWSAASPRPAVRPAPPPPRVDPLCLRGGGEETAGVLFARSSSLFERALPAPPAGTLGGRTPSESGDRTGWWKNKRVPTGLRESPLYAPPPAMAPGPRLGPGHAREAGVTAGA